MSKSNKDSIPTSDDQAKEYEKDSTGYVQERFDPKKTLKDEATSEAKTKPEKSKINDDEEEEESSTESDGGAQDTPLSEEKLKAAMVVEGMEREIKQLYLGKEGVDGAEHEWVDRMPMAMSMKASAMSAKERERSKFVALVRMELRPRARFTDDNPVQIHSLVVQSPLLRKVLEKVFEDHPDMNAAQNKLSFEKPLEPFVHRWSNLLEAVEEEKDVETKEHLDLLLDAIKPELEGTLATRDMCIAHDAITFEQLWMIFEPGGLVISVTDKTECAYKIVKPEIRKNSRGCWFVMECVCADWDGETYGKASVVLAITIFSGSQKISQLDVIPLNLHPNKDRLTKTLLERGKRFTELADVKYMVYRGTAIDRSHPSEPRKLYVDGRIVIDSDGYIRFNPGEDVMITPFEASQGTLEEPNYWKRYRQDRFFSQYDKKDTSDRAELTDEQLIMCRHLVRGFSLKLKRWLDFQIEGVTDVVWNDRAFDRLILPGDHKNLLLAFAKGQRDSDDNFDDIIEGKGKGMIIQLSGPPGVGKTLTAEAVAETMRVPLYTISAGDLGVRPDIVQSHLSNAFQLARNWSAVLLLDEADVFMEKRSTNDLERNQLVSLFLQSLEYYQGTLFLTTNRVETFDPAFESRVHIAMRFDELSTDSRREIWKTFLGVQPKSGEAKSDITEEEIEEFVGMGMNGRQIKNVVKSASLLALSEKGRLRAEHVQTVLRIKRAERERR